MRKSKNQPAFQIRSIRPKTENQRKVFDEYDAGKHLMLHGVAGTGKTYISLYLGLQEVLRNKGYHNVTIIRSVVPSRDMGFLPGSVKEKAKIYEEPYRAITTDLFNRRRCVRHPEEQRAGQLCHNLSSSRHDVPRLDHHRRRVLEHDLLGT